MWRSSCAIVLLAAFTLAQSVPPTTEVQQPTATRSVLAQPPPPYRQYTFYAQIRQGTTEKAAIMLGIEQGFVTSPRSIVPGIVPLKLELQSGDGITVQDIAYPKPIPRVLPFQKERIPLTIGEPIRFKLRADRSAALGPHKLTGKLTFQVVGKTGVSAPQSIDVWVPLTVVNHNAKVRRGEWPYYEMNRAAVVTLIVLSPVLIALAIPIMAVCTIAFHTPGCE